MHVDTGRSAAPPLRPDLLWDTRFADIALRPSKSTEQSTLLALYARAWAANLPFSLPFALFSTPLSHLSRFLLHSHFFCRPPFYLLFLPFSYSFLPPLLFLFFPILSFLSPCLYLLCPRIHFFARLSIRHSPEARFLFVLPSSAVSPNPFLLHSLSDRVSFFPSHAIPPSRPLFPRTSPTIPPRFSLDLYVSFLLYSRPSIRSFASFSSSLFRTLVPLPFYLRFTLSLYRLFHPLLRCPGPLFPLSRYNTAVFGAAWPHVSRDFECIGLDTPQLGAPFRTNFMLNADFSLGYIPAR